MPPAHRSRPGSGRTAAARRCRTVSWIAALGVAVLPAVAAPSAWANLVSPPTASVGGAADRLGSDRLAAGAARALEEVRTDPGRLRAFLLGMPKGADLHNHLSGAVSTESLLRYAIAAGLCVDDTMTAKPGPCASRARPAVDAERDRVFRKAVIDAWSTRGFVEHHGETGHDHFFNTFIKFGAATTGRGGDMLAEAARDAYRNGALYLETLVSRQSGPVRTLASSIGYDPNLEALRYKIIHNPQWPGIVHSAQTEIAEQVAGMRRDLRCGTVLADPACQLQVRFDHQVARAEAPEVVFAQLLLGFELAETNPAVVGVNLVQPEAAS